MSTTINPVKPYILSAREAQEWKHDSTARKTIMTLAVARGCTHIADPAGGLLATESCVARWPRILYRPPKEPAGPILPSDDDLLGHAEIETYEDAKAAGRASVW